MQLIPRLNPKLPILIIDDEENFLLSVATSLELSGLGNSVSCTDGRQAEDLLSQGDYSCILLDLFLPYRSGLEGLSAILTEHPLTPVIVVTAVDDIDMAVRCVKAGAFDYLVKPVDGARLATTVRSALELRELRSENSSLRRQLISPGLVHPNVFTRVITRSDSLRGIFRYVEAIAGTNLPILIQGETGVGKELIAHAVHEASGRTGMFVPVNAAGMDDPLFSDALFGHVRGAFTGADRNRTGLVHQASGGTLFLDEIGDLSPDSQTKLLRLLQEKEYYPLGASRPEVTDARFVFATCHDLPQSVHEGLFRQDLYYRLQSHAIIVPPLRDRRCDISPLFHHFLHAAASVMNRPVPAVSAEILELLAGYDFPGNVRELEGLASDALICSPAGVLSLEYFTGKIGRPRNGSLPAKDAGPDPISDPAMASPARSFPTLKEAEEQLVAEALRLAGGNKTRAASLLGISRQALCNRLRRRSP